MYDRKKVPDLDKESAKWLTPGSEIPRPVTPYIFQSRTCEIQAAARMSPTRHKTDKYPSAYEASACLLLVTVFGWTLNTGQP